LLESAKAPGLDTADPLGQTGELAWASGLFSIYFLASAWTTTGFEPAGRLGAGLAGRVRLRVGRRWGLEPARSGLSFIEFLASAWTTRGLASGLAEIEFLASAWTTRGLASGLSFIEFLASAWTTRGLASGLAEIEFLASAWTTRGFASGLFIIYFLATGLEPAGRWGPGLAGRGGFEPARLDRATERATERATGGAGL
jgi:hypothetical protein